jgi:hypothetical protein
MNGITVAVSRGEDATLRLMIRFEDGDTIGDGYEEVSPGGEALGISHEVWARHAGELVRVGEAGELTPVRSKPEEERAE